MGSSTHRSTKEENQTKEETQQNKCNDQDKESGTSLAQEHKNTMCHCCGEKRHCVSECPMQDKTSQENWTIKKGMQMVQNLNDEATAEQTRQ